MTTNTKYWLTIVAILLVSLLTGSVFLLLKHEEHKPVEIVLSESPEPEFYGEIYIGGAVTNPGFYPLMREDTIESLISSAGLSPDADLSRIKIYIPRHGEIQQTQKVNLNRAETWLISALPGIGVETAQAIVDYRNQHGPFRRIEDLLKVRGIGSSTLTKIKDLVTLEE